MRLMPGLEEEVITFLPAPAPPYSMLMAATSLSAWNTTMPVRSQGLAAVRYSITSLCGVMG